MESKDFLAKSMLSLNNSSVLFKATSAALFNCVKASSPNLLKDSLKFCIDLSTSQVAPRAGGGATKQFGRDNGGIGRK